MLQSAATFLNAQQTDFPKLTGPYLGQKPPGMTPEIFAPGIVSTDNYREFSGTFTPDGKEYYFFRFGENAGLMESKLTEHGWTYPKPLFDNTNNIDNEPHITYDGSYFFFCSNRPYPGCGEGRRPTQVWFMKRIDGKWSSPIHLRMGMAPSSTKEGKVLIGSTFFNLTNDSLVQLEELSYNNSVNLQDKLPSNHSCISWDESYRLFDYKETLYIHFRKKDGSWDTPINLSEKLNINGSVIMPTLSPDNKYLFYCYNGDIYWVSAKIIRELRPKSAEL